MKKDEKTINTEEKKSKDVIDLSDADATEFMAFLERREEYLDTGLGAFHTDDHSNW